MRKVYLLLLILLFATPLVAQKAGGQSLKQIGKPPIFDPTRDAAKDIEQAMAKAARTGKRVLLDVGGNWNGLSSDR